MLSCLLRNSKCHFIIFLASKKSLESNLFFEKIIKGAFRLIENLSKHSTILLISLTSNDTAKCSEIFLKFSFHDIETDRKFEKLVKQLFQNYLVI